MSKKLKNAISINISSILFSNAVKGTLIVVLLASFILNFWPFFVGIISNNDNRVVVQSNIKLGFSEFENIKIVDSNENPDIEIEYKENMYYILVKTSKGDANINHITNQIYLHNMEEYIGMNIDQLTEEELLKLSNQNIEIRSEVRESKLSDSMYIFILATGIIVFLLMALLLIRIGAEVGNEKGSKVTEIILTSISKKEFYFAHIVGGVGIIIISFIIVFIPIIAAFIINNPDITQDYSMIDTITLAKVFIHCIITSCSLMIIAISVCSLVQQTEDIGPLNLLVMAPMFISYIYFGFTVNIYTGFLYWLKYIPIISFYQNFSGIMLNKFSFWDFAIIESVSLVFIIAIYQIGYVLFKQNIATDV